MFRPKACQGPLAQANLGGSVSGACGMAYVDWSSVKQGQRYNGVFTVVCSDHSTESHMVMSSDRQCYRMHLSGGIPEGAHQVTCLDVKVVATTPCVFLEADSQTQVFSIKACEAEDMFKVVDLCCGMGTFSAAFEEVGFTPSLGVDSNATWADLFAEFHAKHSTPFYHAQAGDVKTVSTMLSSGLQHNTILAGVSCQPFSQMGDARGMEDERSGSLAQVLQTAWLCQATTIVLECVPPVLQNEGFQSVLAQYASVTGYHVTQRVLSLSNGWAAKRDRWFAVLTAPMVGPISIPDIPIREEFQRVQDVISHPLQCDEDSLRQLTLNLYELSKFYSYAAGGMDKQWVDFTKPLPTCLHSAGNQMYACKCGCRGPLSEQRIQQKGLVASLIQLETSQSHEVS